MKENNGRRVGLGVFTVDLTGRVPHFYPAF